MDRALTHADIRRLQEAVNATREAAHQVRLDSCDVGDIDEAIEAVNRELAKPIPNKNTLILYLNSLARSLLAAPHARAVRDEIDAALRSAGLPVTWDR